MDKTTKHRVGHLAHDFLEGRLSYADFSKAIDAIPDLDDDEDVCELLYVVVHEPPGTLFVGEKWWKLWLFKVTSREEREAEHRREVQRLIQRILAG